MIEEAIRLADLASGEDLPGDLDDTRICYWKAGGAWWIYLPRGGIGPLEKHVVMEHEDGTITVSPSIGMYRAEAAVGHYRSARSFARHGYLERGKWREL